MKVGETIGRWQVLRELGRGGMGVVVAARDATGQEVAIKLLTGLDPGDRLRFLEEARALRRLVDPGLVQVLEADLSGPNPYLVMPLLPGENLSARLRRGPLPIDEALLLAQEIARTLQRLHQAGVVHRDLKPANVIVDPAGRPVLIDLGLALLLDRTARLTRTGELLGTPGYMAPEQVKGETAAVGPASDVYGLGAVLHALLTGRPPFQAPGALEVLAAILTAVPRPPSASRPEVAPEIDRLVLACLAKAPCDRPLLSDFLAALQRLSRMPAPRDRAGLSRRAAILLGALLLLGLGAAVWANRGNEPVVAPSAPVASPPRAPSHLERADALARGGDHEGAKAEYDRAIEEDPACVPALIARAGLRSAEGDTRGALEDLERAIELEPDSPRGFIERGTLRRRMRDGAGALADYELAVEVAPDSILARAARGQVLHDLDDAAGARSDLEKVRQLAPGGAEDHFARARLSLALGEAREALPDCRRAIELDPSNAQHHIFHGNALKALGDLTGTLQAYDRAIALEPRNAEAHSRRGVAREMVGNLAGARADLDLAVELEPLSAPAWSNRASLRYRTRDVPGAFTDLLRALELDPTDPEDRLKLAAVRREMGDVVGAASELERVANEAPGHPRADWARTEAARLRELAEQR